MPFRERLTEPGLPTSSLNRSTLSMNRQRPISAMGVSPIAADGGFGPMNNQDSEDESHEPNTSTNEDDEIKEGFGDDFDDFEAGAVDEDFGDFGEGFQEDPSSQKHESEPAGSDHVQVTSISPFVSRSIVESRAHILQQVISALVCEH